MNGAYRKFVVVTILLMLAASSSWAQTGTTSLNGTVTDKSGAAVVGAQISLTSNEQGQVRTASTKGSGEYEFLSLPPGKYTLTVDSGI